MMQGSGSSGWVPVTHWVPPGAPLPNCEGKQTSTQPPLKRAWRPRLKSPGTMAW